MNILTKGNSGVDKIAIISDIHGNMQALEAVLAHIEQAGITRIFCLGDLVAIETHYLW